MEKYGLPLLLTSFQANLKETMRGTGQCLYSTETAPFKSSHNMESNMLLKWKAQRFVLLGDMTIKNKLLSDRLMIVLWFRDFIFLEERNVIIPCGQKDIFHQSKGKNTFPIYGLLLYLHTDVRTHHDEIEIVFQAQKLCNVIFFCIAQSSNALTSLLLPL